MAVRIPRLWAVKVLVALLGGVLLAVLSVPAAAFVSQRWGAFSGSKHVTVESTLLQLDDGGAYLLLEQLSTKHGHTAPPRLLRHRVGLRVHPDGELASMIDPDRHPPQPDTRPAFLRHPPPIEYTEVRCASSGWPWHAGYSRDVRDPLSGFGTRHTAGEARFTIGGRDYMLPYLPHWPGLLGNTAFFAALVFLPWAGVRLARSVHHRRRGGCARCGYPLDDGMERCPECGATASIARTPPPTTHQEAE